MDINKSLIKTLNGIHNGTTAVPITYLIQWMKGTGTVKASTNVQPSYNLPHSCKILGLVVNGKVNLKVWAMSWNWNYTNLQTTYQISLHNDGGATRTVSFEAILVGYV